MNENPKRDNDVILRQSKALLDLFNSRCPIAEFMAQLILYNEVIVNETKMCFDAFFDVLFDLGIICGPSRHQKSMFSYPNTSFL